MDLFGREVTTWGATTSQIPAVRDHLIAAGVSLVVMESAGVYWKPKAYHFGTRP